MRLQLAIAALLVSVAPVAADGQLSARAAYYKERATRVEQPMLDGMFDVAERGVLTAHFLVDAITSASSSSGAANAQPFTEKRYEGGLGYTHQFDGFRLGGDAKYSTESDYDSLYLGLHGGMDLAQKNAAITAGAGVSTDKVTTTMSGGLGAITLQCDPNDPKSGAASCDLTTYSGFVSFSQILSKNAVAAVTYDLASMQGFQSNPYRQVITAAQILPERHPDSRLRQAIGLSARYYVPQTETTLIGAYRYYRDNWHVRAHTPELRVIQQIGSFADAGFRFRYYTQAKAYFYEDRYQDDSSQYISDDPKLSKFSGETIEAKLGIFGEEFGLGGRWAAARIEGLLEYELQHNRFGNAVIAHVALTVPLSY